MPNDRPWPRTWVLFLLASLTTVAFASALGLFQEAENVTPAEVHDQHVILWILGGAGVTAWLACALGLYGRGLLATLGFVAWAGLVAAIPLYGYLS